jgi:hypothetical protein
MVTSRTWRTCPGPHNSYSTATYLRSKVSSSIAPVDLDSFTPEPPASDQSSSVRRHHGTAAPGTDIGLGRLSSFTAPKRQWNTDSEGQLGAHRVAEGHDEIREHVGA